MGREPVWSEADSYLVLRPVVVDATDPKPDQAQLRARCLAADIDVRSLVLNLFEHRLFNRLGGNGWGGTTLPAAPAGTTAVLVAVTLAVMAAGGRRHRAAAERTVKQSLQQCTGAVIDPAPDS